MCRSICSAVVLVVAVLITASTTDSFATPPPLPHLPDLPPDPSPTLLTDCPLYHTPDPESPDGPCICDPDACPRPSCLPTEILLAIPPAPSASCCPASYQCVPCPDADLAASKCRCTTTMMIVDNGSYVHRDTGLCECLDEGQSWDWMGGCQCDVDRCRLPDLCLGNRVEVRVMEDCCERVECVECPEDSVAQIADAFSEIEAKCICRPCPDKVCSDNEVIVIRKPGRNIPSYCCDLYDCIVRGCTINGTKYDEGEQWSIENDTQCRCQNGIALCNRPIKERQSDELVNCFHNGNSYRDGEVWADDQCTTCTCHSGQSKCIAHMCMERNESIVPKPPICLPTCMIGCLDGSRQAVDARGCLLCECVLIDDVEPEYTENTDNVYKIVAIVAGVLAMVVITTVTFFLLRRKCKRMRYYPETKHNLLLDNNNTFRDIYISTTKPEDQVTLPLYKPTTIENAKK